MFKLVNEAKQIKTICSGVIVADLNPPLIDFINDSGHCWQLGDWVLLRSDKEEYIIKHV